MFTALLHEGDGRNTVCVRGGGERRKEGERCREGGRRVCALMPVSLLDMLLIPRQEYQQYLTGNVTECQVGKCHWGRTGG